MRVSTGPDAHNVEKACQDCYKHAAAGHENSRRRGHGRRHPLEAINQQKCGNQIDDSDQQLRDRIQHRVSLCRSWLRSGGFFRGMFFDRMFWFADAWLKHGEHPLGDGITPRRIAGAQQHGKETEYLLLQRVGIEQSEQSSTTTMPCTKLEP